MRSSEIRSKFLQYFKSQGHVVKASASLIPDDPGLLFTVAGMVPFKPQFLGQVKLEFTRAASSQKCIRTNDIDNVGRTRRHHTFFEMLGNFSFGDYFKEEAIAWAWEFLTSPKWMGIPADKLWVSIFENDDEAELIWKKYVKPERIVRMGEKDNFWTMGPTGPCGPCSEIYYDFGAAADPNVKEGDIAADGDRYVEIWNNVFTQFDKQADGSLAALPKKNIDTGMGLERLSAVMQGVTSSFETDLFMPIIQSVALQAKVVYGKDPKIDWSLKVIADHLRGGVFLIADGVLPSNEGRGYVLRRILRRAVRHGRLLGVDRPFLAALYPSILEIFKDAYPELAVRGDAILGALRDEEEKFGKALHAGTELLADLMAKAGNNKILDGAQVFRLYDTFGFPLELTQEMAGEKGFSVDETAFKAEMETQRKRARAAREDAGHGDAAIYGTLATKHGKTAFSGYEKLVEEGAKVLAIVRDGVEVSEVGPDSEVEVLLDRTPFYAESGGQVGDHGVLSAAGVVAQIVDTKKRAGGELHLHRALVKEGVLKTGSTLRAEVSVFERAHIRRHHSATHILHTVLREVLGKHVQQEGSYVGADRLRLDFSHPKALSLEERLEVEDRVNRYVLADQAGQTRVLSLDQAKAEGAMALFGEKYGDSVRVVNFGDFSKELCGGTHVDATGQIGLFRIVAEMSVSSGVRRIEAVAGEIALRHWRETDAFVHGLAERLKSAPGDLPTRVEKLLVREKELQKKIEKLQQGGGGSLDKLLAALVLVEGVKLVVGRVDENDEKAMKALSDQVKDKLVSGVVVIGAADDDKATLVVGVSADLTAKVHAGKLVGVLAPLVGGKGGGRPDMAQAGGKDTAGLDNALAQAQSTLLAMLKA